MSFLSEQFIQKILESYSTLNHKVLKIAKVAFFKIFGFMYLSVNMIGKLPRKKVENSVEKKVKVRGHRQKH